MEKNWHEVLQQLLAREIECDSEVHGKRRAAAYHEAGHTIIALFHGAQPSAVSIEPPDERLAGFSAGEYLPEVDEASVRYGNICMLFAGMIAESLHYSGFSVSPDHAKAERVDDVAEAFEKGVDRLSGFEDDLQFMSAISETCINKCFEATLDEVEMHWNLIVSLATELLRCGTLSGEELRSLLQKDHQGNQFLKNIFLRSAGLGEEARGDL